MKAFWKVGAVLAVTVTGIGVSAAGAPAYSISGGAYASVPNATQAGTVGGAYSWVCDFAQFSGDATGAATTYFAAVYDGCTIFGFGMDLDPVGAWSMTIIGGSGGTYQARIDLPSASAVALSMPITGCSTLTSGPQAFVDGAGGVVVQVQNVPGGIEVSADVDGVSYTSSSCPFSNGSDGVYTTGGVVFVPGISVS